jgi:hypothetical protein
MTDEEKAVLLDMYWQSASPEMCIYFRHLVVEGVRDRKAVRRIVRGLAAKDYTYYARGLQDVDTGEMAGAGYGLTDTGLKLARELDDAAQRG